MRTLLVMNSKGGSGKSTLCTNLAAYFTHVEQEKVVLQDFDRQGSSTDWLTVRPENSVAITGQQAWEGASRIPRDTTWVIMDSPAALQGKELQKLVRSAQTILIPVLPSPMDIRAAAKFVQDILLVGKVSSRQVKIGIVANRVREFTLIYQQLEKFLNRLNFDFVARLRDTQNYVRSAERGIGIHEMPPSTVYEDLSDWEPLTKWLKSKNSLP